VGDSTARVPQHTRAFDTAFGLEALVDADIVIVPSWRDPAEKPRQALLDALVAAHARGAHVVGLCLGAYVLAYAGLLNGHRAATHWELEQDFLSRFPEVQLDTNALYVDDHHLITSAGVAAGLDCCLSIVRQHSPKKTSARCRGSISSVSESTPSLRACKRRCTRLFPVRR
jgi:transcriptional regulator GlxA family with amidase domain